VEAAALSNAIFTCEDCGSHIGLRSRTHNVWEKFVLPIFLLRPARCANCYRRAYCLIFVPLSEPLLDPGSQSHGSTPNSGRAA
jgi:hypothetical protein